MSATAVGDVVRSGSAVEVADLAGGQFNLSNGKVGSQEDAEALLLILDAVGDIRKMQKKLEERQAILGDRFPQGLYDVLDALRGAGAGVRNFSVSHEGVTMTPDNFCGQNVGRKNLGGWAKVQIG